MTTFPVVTLDAIEGVGSVRGELVLESETAFQLAVGGRVVLYSKESYRRKPMDFSDIFSTWRR